MEMKVFPVAQAWLKKLTTQESPKISAEIPCQVKIKTEPAMPIRGASTADTTSVAGATPKIRVISVPKVDVLKLKVAPEDFTSPINLGTSRHNDTETVKEPPKDREISKKLPDDAINIPDIVEDEPECIDLDEEDKIYRYFCQECEGKVSLFHCMQHPIYGPLQAVLVPLLVTIQPIPEYLFSLIFLPISPRQGMWQLVLSQGFCRWLLLLTLHTLTCTELMLGNNGKIWF